MLPTPVKRRRTDMLLSSSTAAPPPPPPVVPPSVQTATTKSSSSYHQQLHRTTVVSSPAVVTAVTPTLPVVLQQQAIDRKTHARSVAPDADGITAAPSCDDPQKQLHLMAMEVEPVVIRLSSSSQNSSSSATAAAKAGSTPKASGSLRTSDSRPPVIGYRPTYRAVLAKRGYLVKNTLGSGSYSKVKKVYFIAKRNAVMQQAAVKIIDRQKAPQDYQDKFLPRELKHWPRLRHPNLVALIDCFQDSQRVYMVLEYADGGDALKHIQGTGAISEELARTWTSQVTSAIGYMHKMDIAHRDLKLENLLIDASKNVKICDFGFVREASAGDLSQTYCGSKSYAAPEILQGRPYDPKKADVWAIGVILYIFVTGKMPFDETKGTRHILEEQRALDFHWATKSHRVSVDCQFEDRPTVYDVMIDSWFMSRLQQQPRLSSPSVNEVSVPSCEPRPAPQRSNALVLSPGLAVLAAVRAQQASDRQHSATAAAVTDPFDMFTQHNRQTATSSTTNKSSRQQNQLLVGGGQSRSSSASPLSTSGLASAFNVAPSTAESNGTPQQQQQPMQQFQHANVISVSPGAH